MGFAVCAVSVLELSGGFVNVDPVEGGRVVAAEGYEADGLFWFSVRVGEGDVEAFEREGGRWGGMGLG